jgi:hypothetical protein
LELNPDGGLAFAENQRQRLERSHRSSFFSAGTFVPLRIVNLQAGLVVKSGRQGIESLTDAK